MKMYIEAARVLAETDGRISHDLREHRACMFDLVLTALEKAREILDGEYPKTDDRHPSHWLDAVLAEANEVEI